MRQCGRTPPPDAFGATALLRISDLRTKKRFTLKTNPLRRADLVEFVTLYNPTNRHHLKATWCCELDSGSEVGMKEAAGAPTPAVDQSGTSRRC
jgi:type I restriction enzyme M protein